jgi:DNA-binding Xre family transcriptional regulator
MYKRKNINDIVNETILTFGEVYVKSKIKDKLDEYGLSITDLSNLTGIRYASVNEIVNSKKATLNLQHLTAIMIALRVNSFDELFELKFADEEKAKQFYKEVEQYDKYGLPDSAIEKMYENKKRIEEHYIKTKQENAKKKKALK